ncbi:MAG: tellurite resistance/C4-dicarboxylate transporter family protein [Ktedonobacterales bacterium]
MGTSQTIRRTWLEWVRSLYTGYFACVMATGIVSVALLLNHTLALSYILWALGFVFLAFLVVVYILRGVRFPQELKRDLHNPATAFGFFTFVAALGVMATRSALGGWTLAPGILTVIAVVAWFGLTYWLFASLTFTNDKPIEQALNGSWLIAIVATESLAITWVLLIPIAPAQRDILQLVAYAYWTFGVLLYLIFITLIMYRFFFLRVRPQDLSPPYWINMGAMAITSVAGVRLLQAAHPSAFLLALRPYIEGFTVMMWAWGTWWIPLLLIIGVWKYGAWHEPIRYQPALWSIVFPLGMYSTSLQLLSHIPGLDFLETIGPVSVWIAFAAWLAVAVGWLWSAITAGRGVARQTQSSTPVSPHHTAPDIASPASQTRLMAHETMLETMPETRSGEERLFVQ